MKRALESLEESSSHSNSSKIRLVEPNPAPNGVSLVSHERVNKKSYTELMELEQDSDLADRFANANANNKMDIVRRQIKNLQEVMVDIFKETKLSRELNQVACNFIKKPGHIYHLYERNSGQKYFSILSPQEWGDPPHTFLGSFVLQTDLSWKPLELVESQPDSTSFLQMLVNGKMKELIN